MKKLTAGETLNKTFLDFMGITVEEIRPECLQGAGFMRGDLSIPLSRETSAMP